MYSFRNDYSEGCHPNILNALMDSNFEQQEGYGEDRYCQQARELILQKLETQNADIHFVSGGTQANSIVIASILKPFESVISAVSGHINQHEAGAIEATGHKIESVVSPDGKLTVEKVNGILENYSDHHQTRPRLVYISNSTEEGTIYSREDLEALYLFCQDNNLFLFLDGARLGSALCAKGNNLTLSDLSRLTDVFYIGGTKNGALLGEAIVINNDHLKPDFKFHLKQRGALLSKGRMLGIQFRELFKDDLFFDLAKHSNDMAYKLSSSIQELGFDFYREPVSNQIFPVFSNRMISELNKEFGFYVWKKMDAEHSAIRLVTSWATMESEVFAFVEKLKVIKG